MPTVASNQLYSCPAHGTDHDLFLSYRAQTDADTVQALKEVLTSVALRRYGKPLSVFHDVDCLNNPSDPPASSISALPKCKAVFLLLSLESFTPIIENTLAGQDDNVLLEINTALDLKDAKRSLPVLPLGIATKETKDGVDGFTPFEPKMVDFSNDPAFASLKQTLDRIKRIQSLGFRPDQMHKRVYRLLNLIHPIPPNMDLITTIYRKYFCDSKFRFDPAHLDTLLKQLTLTGRAVISGMGGMGKSVLAVQILFFMMGIMNASNKEDLLAIKAETIGIKPQYRQVFWINCSTESTAIDGLIEMFPGIKPDEIKEHASRFLANTHGYLLVLDNVDDISVVDSVFEHSKSAGFSGDVVVTTRLASLPPGAFASALETKIPGYKHDPLRLVNWDDKTTLDYIMSSSPMIVQRLVSDEAKKSLDSIVAKISGYPLVIQTFMTFAENYDTPLSVLEATFAGALELQDGDDDTRSSLKVIVDLSLDSLMKRGDEGIEAARLFGALSLVAPDDIPLDLITAMTQKMELSADVARLVTMMCESGLLRPGPNEQFYTHSLTQRVAHEWVVGKDELINDRIEDATGEALLDLTQSENQSAFALSAHLEQYAERTVPEVYTKKLQSKIDFRRATGEERKGMFAKSMESYQASLSKSIALHGTRDHKDIATILSRIGAVAQNLGRLDDALTYLNDSLEIYIKLYSTRRHISVAFVLNCLGEVTRQQGQHQLALSYFQESLDISTEAHSSRLNIDVARVLNNMGSLAHDQGQLDAAFAYLSESLDIKTQVYGTHEHPSVTKSLTNLGNVLLSKGDPAQALKCYAEDLEMTTKLYGTRLHPDIAQILNNMGAAASELSCFDAAQRYYQEALDIKIKIYGTRNHADVASTLNNMGVLAAETNNLEEALRYFQEDLEITTALHGSRIHADTAASLNNLGALARDIGHLDQSLRYFRESLDVSIAIHGTRIHPDIAQTLSNMGAVAYDQRDLCQAHTLLCEALEAFNQIHNGQPHREIIVVLNCLGLVASAQGNHEESSQYYEQLVHMRIEIFNSRKHPQVALALGYLGAAEEAAGHLESALRHYRESLEILRDGLANPEHPLVRAAVDAVTRTEEKLTQQS